MCVREGAVVGGGVVVCVPWAGGSGRDYLWHTQEAYVWSERERKRKKERVIGVRLQRWREVIIRVVRKEVRVCVADLTPWERAVRKK